MPRRIRPSPIDRREANVTPTQQRDRAVKLAKSEGREALAISRSISDPWYRCQALAWVARYAPEEQYEQLVTEAFASAERAPDPFNALAASAWPVRVMIERGDAERARLALSQLLCLSKCIVHEGSRSEAVSLMLHAVLPSSALLWRPVAQELFTCVGSSQHWRARRAKREAILLIDPIDSGFAKCLLESIPDVRERQNVKQRLTEPQRPSCRPFFW